MQKTTTFLMFVGDQVGKAEEAVNLYVSMFENSKIDHIEHFKAGEPGGEEGMVKHTLFTLDGQQYMASDSTMPHDFTFTPAMSIYVQCSSETEIDKLYETLSKGGEVKMPLGDYGFSTKFGWVTDKYGVSWQFNLAS